MAEVLQIGKKRWLAGMSWVSFEDAPSKQELREDGQRLSASWSCVRISESAIQAGFSAPVEGTKNPARLFSLAAMLADSREQPWLGIFKISEGLWWYVAVRDGQAILPDGDVCGGEEEILAARERHSGYSDWNYIEGDVHLLEEFINGIDAKPSRVRSLNSSPSATVIPLVLAASVVCALGGGYWAWEKERADQARSDEVARQKMRLAISQIAPAAPSPLLTTPTPDAWLQRCQESLFALPLSNHGWVLDKTTCETSTVSAGWSRSDGATVANRPEGALSADGELVTQVISMAPFLKAASVTSADEPVDLAQAKLIFRAWAQAANFILNLTETVAPQGLPGSGAGDAAPKSGVPIPPVRPQTSFVMEIPISPFGVNMSSIPGLRLTTLKSTTSGWRVEGVLYGR